MTAAAVSSAVAGLGRHRRFASAPAGTAKKSQVNPAQVAGSYERLQRNDTVYKLQRLAARLLPTEGVAKCGACAVDAGGVQVVRDSAGRAYTRGLIRCKSVWHCPSCAAKIAERRRSELVAILSEWRARGGFVNMLTLTLPHYMHQPLSVVLDALTAALRRFNSGRNRVKELLKAAGFFGQIRALEVTHGENGWHPHQHILLLTDHQLTPDQVAALQLAWSRCLAAVGLASPRPEIAAQVQGGESAAEYVSKTGWGMAEELSRAHTKKGGRGGMTPFQLLEAAALGDDMAASYFVEYAHNFKGKKQIYMSNSVKQFAREIEADIKEDSEIVDNEEIEVVEVVGYIEQADWTLIYRYNLRAELLHAVENEGYDGLLRIVTIGRALRELRAQVN